MMHWWMRSPRPYLSYLEGDSQILRICGRGEFDALGRERLELAQDVGVLRVGEHLSEGRGGALSFIPEGLRARLRRVGEKHRALERALDVARVGQRPHDRRGHVLARDDEARAADALVDAERAWRGAGEGRGGGARAGTSDASPARA